MENPGGRPRGRDLNPLELRHLRMILAARARAQQTASMYDQELEDFVLELRESGCSARSVADAVGVGTSTVQGWTKNARQRRDQG